MPKTRTAAKPEFDPRLHILRMEDTLEMMDHTVRLLGKRELLPPGWMSAHESTPCQPVKTKMTIRLDSDMLAWYRRLGTGYQNRINEVLRCYMDGVISGFIEPARDYDSAGPRE